MLLPSNLILDLVLNEEIKYRLIFNQSWKQCVHIPVVSLRGSTDQCPQCFAISFNAIFGSHGWSLFTGLTVFSFWFMALYASEKTKWKMFNRQVLNIKISTLKCNSMPIPFSTCGSVIMFVLQGFRPKAINYKQKLFKPFT